MVGFGAIRYNAGGAPQPHSRSSSVAFSGTPPAGAAASTASTSTRSSSSLSSIDADEQSPARPHHTLEAPSRKQYRSSSSSKPVRLFQKLRNALPLVLAPRCGRSPAGSNPFSSGAGGGSDTHALAHVAGRRRPCQRVTGTLYGHRKGRVALALQETPRSLPSLVVELALQTHALLRELGNPAGARIVLETERRGAGGGDRRSAAGAAPLLEEAAWTMFCNGRKTGYAVRREASGGDLAVMETLRAVSMGAGVLPASAAGAGAGAGDDEVAYMRGCFEHFVGSRDSESLYMMAPQGGGNGPELAVFFVRL
ncbi:protein MIZU-KUSSEI 1 [Brachypodium distachyon]|uniref:Protein MIZU-KUSSEI 1 n=1 Tax=Brachypodium distachyon TaxID=15368 RepID=I1I170_BRADI|nr:protein MIZU-KUSSEI 1 [Brachypodium distachyon]KQJ95214.1 hypothetical protein BRADI_3g15820v3 [Brachypodium distachyon]|eukprot:XP_010236431.2 protein MIZU-KUSSEI 1 [Brachypodium distachyon]